MVVLNSLLIPPDPNSDAELPASPEACPPADSFAALLAASWFTPPPPDLPRAETVCEMADRAAPAPVAAVESGAPTPNLLPVSFPDLASPDQPPLVSSAPASVTTFDLHSLSRRPLLADLPAPAAENEETIRAETGQSAAPEIELSENAAVEFEQMNVRRPAFRQAFRASHHPPEGGTTNASPSFRPTANDIQESPPLIAHPGPEKGQRSEPRDRGSIERSTLISVAATPPKAQPIRNSPGGFPNEPGQEAEPERLSAKDQSPSVIDHPEEPFTSSSLEGLKGWPVVRSGERERPEPSEARLWPSRRSLALPAPYRTREMPRSAATELKDGSTPRALHDAEMTAPVSVTTEADNKSPAFAEGRPTITSQMLIEADAEPVLPSPRPVADAKVRSQKELVQLVEVESESPAIMINKDAPDEPSLSPAPENQPLASAEEEALLAKPVKTAQPQNQAASSEEFPIRQDPLLTRKLFQAQDDAARDVGRTASSPALPPAARRPGLSELTVRPTFSEEFSLSLKRRPETMKITARDVEQAVSLLQLPPSAHREVTSRLTACSTFSAENPDSGAAAPAQPPSQNNETETETGNRAVMHHQPPTEPRPTRPLGARPTETSHSWSGAGLAENAKSSQSQTPGSPAAFEAPALGRHRQNDQEPAPIDPPSSDALPAPLSLETAQAQNAPSAASLTARASEIIRQTIEPVVVAASGLERREARAFSLHLHPAELGEVEVKLTRDDDGRLNAHLTAQQETARDALADGLSQLRESLERAGLAINQLDVNLSSHSGPGTSAHAGDGQARSSLPHFGPATLAPESADAPLDVEQDRLLSLRA